MSGKIATKLNLSHSLDLFQLQEKLLKAKPSALGDSCRQAVKENKTMKAVQMIKQQIADGHQQSVEWCIGLSAINLVNRLSQ
jgi:hypothetical protein